MSIIENELKPDLNSPSLYFNRELSWLNFNWRVLHEARDNRNPLLERLKFIAITSNNLDEFVMKRVGGLKRQVAAGVRTPSLDGRSPQVQLKEIGIQIREMVHIMRSCLRDEIIPALRVKGINLYSYQDIDEDNKLFLRRYFTDNVAPILTPLGVGPGHPFPFISNLSLSIAVGVRMGDDPELHIARVKIPENRPRWVPLPQKNSYVPLEQVIANNLDQIFPGTEIVGWASFRVTRNANLERNEEEAEDLLDLIQEELRHRRFADVARLEVHHSISEELLNWLMEELKIDEENVYLVRGPLNLRDLFDFGTDIEAPDLRYQPWNGVTHPRLKPLDEKEVETDIFSIIQKGDLLVHHPYHSFSTSVLKLIESAAVDPNVLAIKQTLYRTAKDSPIINALIKAAENGKQVAVLVEIKARFDEANNIEWVHKLETSGCHVTYGLVGLKTHSKTLLIVREEPDGIRRYVHIGTGNYHTGTAKLYTDMGLLSCDLALGRDLTDLFNYLTGYSEFREFRKLLVAPVNMRDRFIELIEREAELHTPENPGRIIAKMNQLEDTDIIKALYRASQAGVKIELIIRGFCCLRPGYPGISDNIKVMSIIGRLLEHSRIFCFNNGGRPKVYIGSGDWMHRNLDARVEAAVPIEDYELKNELMEYLGIILKDKRQAWELGPDGVYTRLDTGDEESVTGSQAELMTLITGEPAP